MHVVERTEAKPPSQKVDLVDIEIDPFVHKVELVGYWVVLAQLWAFLMDWIVG